MYLIQIEAQCIGDHFEVLLDEVKNAELMVEDLVGQILLDFFGEVAVDEVLIVFSPRSSEEQRDCTVYIQARCSLEGPPVTEDQMQKVERVLEERVSYTLMELFGTVIVDRVMIRFPSYALSTS